MLMYVDFLRLTFMNVTVQLHKLDDGAPKPITGAKKIHDVKCVAPKLEKMKASMQDHAAQDEAVLDQERGKIVDLGRLSPGLEDQEDEQEAEAEAEEEEQALRAEHAQGLRALFGKHARQALAAIKFTNAIGGIGHHDEATGDNHEAATDGHSIKTAAAEPYVPLINGEAARIFRPEVHAPLKLVFGVSIHTHHRTVTSKPFSIMFSVRSMPILQHW